MKEQELPHGQKIMGFDSMEEMTEFLRVQEEEANADVLPVQKAISWGSRVIRFVEPDLVVFGQIFTPKEFLRDNSLQDDEPDEEIVQELVDITEAHDRGYRYGRWFSTIVPSGEYGSAHIVSLWPITADDFRASRRRGWRVSIELARRVLREVDEAKEKR